MSWEVVSQVTAVDTLDVVLALPPGCKDARIVGSSISKADTPTGSQRMGIQYSQDGGTTWATTADNHTGFLQVGNGTAESRTNTAGNYNDINWPIFATQPFLHDWFDYRYQDVDQAGLVKNTLQYYLGVREFDDSPWYQWGSGMTSQLAAWDEPITHFKVSTTYGSLWSGHITLLNRILSV